ncbi:MAG TPA: hypothetical protein VMU11_02665, partial [Verrucomicrobiae bacterium]|nr:hypothetical protein [Verrucomicrobiae bacterium]
MARTSVFGIALSAALLGLFASALPASADIPHTVGYQGRLKNSSGSPLTSTFNFTFRLYENPSGGSPVWSETQNGVQTSDGFFAVRLGSVTPFPNGFDFNRPLYLSTEVNSDGEMSPRVAINSVAYAYTAEGVGGYGTAPVNATGGRLYYNTNNNGLYYYDQGAAAWTLLGTSTGTLQSITNAGNITTNPIQFAGGTSTGDLSFTNVSGTSVSSTNLFASNATFGSATILGSAICLQNGTNCPASSATLASVAANGSFTTTTLQLYGGFIGASSTVTSTLTVLGATTLGTLTGTNATFTAVTSTSWLGFGTASGSTLFASSVQVNGQNVCLANGTNCPAGTGIPTLQQVTNAGSQTTSTLSLLGGLVTSSSTVTSTLTVLGT